MNSMLRSASGAAILLGLAGVSPALAQTPTAQGVDQTPQPAATQPAEPQDRVVITGSFIQGTPEDAALPVEVYSQAELEDRGSPRRSNSPRPSPLRGRRRARPTTLADRR